MPASPSASRDARPARVRSFCLYGDTTGETDEFGLPVRYPWAEEYRGKAMVLYGHTPVPHAEWVNNTLCLDTGCVFGGRLTALRYPERELVRCRRRRSITSQQSRSRAQSGGSAPDGPARRDPDVLDITDVLGNHIVETRHHGRVTVREENAAAALEVMSRFALDPRWLLYLPPTMSPVATSTRPDCWNTPSRPSRPIAPRASTPSSAKRSTWARGRSLVCRATPRRPNGASARRTA